MNRPTATKAHHVPARLDDTENPFPRHGIKGDVSAVPLLAHKARTCFLLCIRSPKCPSTATFSKMLCLMSTLQMIGWIGQDMRKVIVWEVLQHRSHITVIDD